MQTLTHRWPMLLIAGSLLLASMTHAAAPATQSSILSPQSSQKDWPDKVVINVGDIRTRISGEKMWTLSGIDYQNTMMATEDSAYGTVFTIRNVGHLGTAHFLDVPGKPNEIEKENVTALRFFVDGKAVGKLTPSMDLTGKSFRMERESDMRGVQLNSSVSVKDNVLIETAHIRVHKPIDLQKGHPLMYAWSAATTNYVFGDDSGIQKRGAFQTEGKTTVAEVVKSARWLAVFDPTSGKGSVWYMTKRPGPAEESFLKIDAPGVYHKVALYSLVDEIVPAGFDGTYQSAIGFFTATPTDWEKKAQQRAAELKAYGAAQSNAS